LADLAIIKSHSRSYASDDNPYSEAQFKTLKYPVPTPALRLAAGRQDLLPDLLRLVYSGLHLTE
jgi:hypothetical protein